MTQEDKELLLKDLSARLPYGFIIYRLSDNANLKISNIGDFAHFLEYSEGEEFKPYLRPMSSITEEEKKTMRSCGFELIPYDTGYTGFANIEICIDEVSFRFMEEFLNAHHFDYRGLIEKGLAISVAKENNPYERF